MAESDFTADFFVGNRRRLRAALKVEQPIVITANGLLQRGADSAYSFSQDANFWYLTGIDEPDIILVIDGEREFLIVAGRSTTRATFDGAVDESHLAAISGITDIQDETSGWNRLDGLLSLHPSVYSLAPAPDYIQDFGMYANPSRARLMSMMERHGAKLQTTDIRPAMARLRMVKQPAELQALQQAIDITAETLNELLVTRRLSRYRHEYELEADISRGFRFRGAAGHSFEPIVAGGKRACTLHNVSNSAALGKNELVICDVGAEVHHYAADITRTVSAAKPTARQRAVYDAVLRTQEYALSLLRPGVKLRRYEQQVAACMGKELKNLGLLTNPTKTNIRRYFPHATSHFLGLNVHDVGDYEQPLQPGVVLTCEPGMYIPEEGIGVRLEDDVLITKDGNQVLSAGCTKLLA